MAEEWYFDTETGQAEQGKATGWENRMGPYATKAEAENALERAKERNEAWDASTAPPSAAGAGA